MELNTEKIKTELKKRDWSVYRLAKEMGMANQTLYKILNDGGNNYTLATVQRIANALGVPPKELLE